MGSKDEHALQRIGHYELLREIARGGMATLHEARHVHLDTRVALKRMLPGLAGRDASLTVRFRNEALAASRVRHPHVVRIQDYGIHDDGLPFLAMELLQGETLAALLARQERMAIAAAVDLVLAILSGIVAVHAAGYVHRDLKPRNIFLHQSMNGARSLPVVIDFGISKQIDGSSEETETALTETGVSLGTAGYMAPEQILSSKTVGPAADQYALAITMYECLTGKLPYEGSCSYEMMHAALEATPRRVRDFRREVPRELDDVIHRALQRDPRDRFASVHAMGEALLPFAGADAVLAWRADVARSRMEPRGMPGGETRGSSPPARASRRAGAPSSGVRFATVALVVGALGACGAFLRMPGPRRAAADSTRAELAAPHASDRSPPPPTAASVASDVPGSNAEMVPPQRSTPLQVVRATPQPPLTTAAKALPVRRGSNGAPILE